MPWFSRSTHENFPSLPWLDPRAVEFMEALLTSDMTVLEHGAGGSTLWFAERVAKVTSVESDVDFYAALLKRVPANVELLYKPSKMLLQPADLLLIDGEPLEDRREWILAAQELSKKYVVLDNANRPDYAKEREELRRKFDHIKTVRCEIGLYLVTEFYARR